MKVQFNSSASLAGLAARFAGGCIARCPLRLQLLVAVLGVGACARKEAPEQGPRLTDTGWFRDTAAFDPLSCPHRWDLTVPEDGARDWYWRDPVKVYAQTDKHQWYAVQWVDARGQRVEHTVVWDASGLSATLHPDEPLAAATDFVLQLTDCGSYREVTFSTSDLGLPLAAPPEALVGNTYYLDFDDATWLEPGGIEGLLALYFNTPVLIGVTYADAQRIDLLGAPGTTDLFGEITQDTTQSTWDIPSAGFEERPFFEATSGDIVLESAGVEVPVSEFRIGATISGDMARLGGGELSGLGDTRYLGELLYQPDNPNAICEIAAQLGVSCVACPDGERYCLFMHAVGLEGTLLPEVTLVPRN